MLSCHDSHVFFFLCAAMIHVCFFVLQSRNLLHGDWCIFRGYMFPLWHGHFLCDQRSHFQRNLYGVSHGHILSKHRTILQHDLHQVSCWILSSIQRGQILFGVQALQDRHLLHCRRCHRRGHLHNV
jgi:hypothetical protein